MQDSGSGVTYPILFEHHRGLYIIDKSGILRQITINDLPVGRSVEETLRLVQVRYILLQIDKQNNPKFKRHFNLSMKMVKCVRLDGDQARIQWRLIRKAQKNTLTSSNGITTATLLFYFPCSVYFWFIELSKLCLQQTSLAIHIHSETEIAFDCEILKNKRCNPVTEIVKIAYVWRVLSGTESKNLIPGLGVWKMILGILSVYKHKYVSLSAMFTLWRQLLSTSGQNCVEWWYTWEVSDWMHYMGKCV